MNNACCVIGHCARPVGVEFRIEVRGRHRTHHACHGHAYEFELEMFARGVHVVSRRSLTDDLEERASRTLYVMGVGAVVLALLGITLALVLG